MIEINLVPDVKQELIKAQRIRSTVITFAIIIGSISIGIVVALSMYVYGVQALRGGLADKDITSKSKELMAVKDLPKTLTVQNQLTKISTLHDNKKINSRIFDLLNAIIPPEPNHIKYSTITINSEASTISFDGQAENSYAALEVFKKTIVSAKVKYYDDDEKEQTVDLASNISIKDTSYGLDPEGKRVLSFTLSFKYVDKLFSSLNKNITIITSNGVNVTDSYLGVPRGIFTNPAIKIKEDD